MLVEQAHAHKPRWVAVTDESIARRVDPGQLPRGTELLHGPDGIARMVSDPETDIVLTAIVGAAGLAGTWAALEAGKTVAVANKETLVMAGPAGHGAGRPNAMRRVLPVDSEHSAIFQAMQSGRATEVEPRRADGQRRAVSRPMRASWPTSPSRRPCAIRPGAWGRKSPSILLP